MLQKLGFLQLQAEGMLAPVGFLTDRRAAEIPYWTRPADRARYFHLDDSVRSVMALRSAGRRSKYKG